MRDMKPLPDRDPARDPNREALATAITAHAGAAHDLKVAKEAAELAASRFYDALRKLHALREEPPAPSGALAAEFISSVGAGNPCTVTVLERSAVDARAQMTAAENDVNVWKQTHEECDLAVRAKGADAVDAKARVERCARAVVCNSEMVKRLGDGLEALQAEVIEKRAVLRFIWGKGGNGELPRPLSERVERLLWQDLDGMEPTTASAAWASAFEELQSNSEAELPS